MSRVVTPTVDAAIEEEYSTKQRARLTVYKSRVFFEEADLTDNAPDFAHPLAETGQYIPEAMSFCETKFVTVMVDADGNMYLQCHDSDTPVDLGIITDPIHRPGIYGHSLFYWDLDVQAWRKATITENDLIGGDPDCLIDDALYSDFDGPGAVFPTSEEDAFLCYIDNGGIGLKFSIAGADSFVCPGRFINPSLVYEGSNSQHAYLTHFAGAAETSYGRFFYFSTYDGSIKCVKYSNGMFSDFEISVPTDLSIARIGNVFSYNDVVHMTFRFERSEEFASAAKYTLFSQSKDGVTFNMDQRVLVTMVDSRFLAAFDPDLSEVFFSSSNRWFKTSAPYQLVQEDAPFTELRSVSVDGNLSGWTANLVSGGEEYFDDVYVIDGAYAKLEVGVATTDGDLDGFEWMTYHDVVVASFDKSWGDAQRTMVLQILPDGLWHTSVMSHPFYMEIQGRQGVYDPAKALDNLYKLSGGAGIKWTLTADLWEKEGEAFLTQSHAGGDATDHWSADLTTFLANYPVFGAASTYEVRIYGWSRAGVPDTNPNTSDATSTATNNDDFYGLIEVEDTNGNVSTIVTTVGELSSTYKHPIQTYFDANVRAGSEPVKYNLTNPGEGKKIKRLGVRVISPTSNTTYYLERVELPGIAALYTAESVADEQPFQVVDAVSNWPLVETLDLDITTGNAADGDQVTMTFPAKVGHVYAIAVVGDVMFDRSGSRYLQDAHFVAISDTAHDPTWDRSYPPGTAPAPNPSVKITFSEWPTYAAAVLVKDDVVAETSPRSDHAYMLHWADPRFEDSKVNAGYIPYFYSDGTALKVALFLEGSGAISNIVGGAFKVYIFESPEVIEDFDFYGGEVGGSTPAVFQVSQGSQTWMTGQFVPLHDYWSFEISNSINIQSGDGDSVYIKNSTAVSQVYRVIGRLIATVDDSPYTDYLNLTYGFGTGPTDSIVIPDNISTIFETTRELTIPAGATWQLWWNVNKTGGDMLACQRRWKITGFGEPISNQVPSPGDFNVSVPTLDTTVTLEGGLGPHIATNKKGVPQISFSTRPYSAFNFEVTGRFQLKGEYSIAGLIGLATNEDNFMLGYIRPGYAGIARVRDGIKEVISEAAVDEVESNKLMDVRFWHRDGIFGVEVKRSQDFWPQRGSQFLYVWDGDDGEIAIQDDIFHVGVYALIDPPKVRITGFRSTQPVMAVMPLDLDPNTSASGISAFPSSGQIDVGGRIYSFSGKSSSLTVPRGPFNLRNNGTWAAQYNKDRLGYTYPNTPSIEFTFFRWWSGSGHATDYANKYVASSEGYAWQNDKTLWRVWITTDGALVWLRNRSRWYSDTMPSYYAVNTEKIWVANALTGMVALTTDEFDYLHPSGCFAFLHSDDSVSLYGFSGFSGERDNSIMDLLDRFCRIAGTLADSPGDVRISTIALDDEEEVSLD